MSGCQELHLHPRNVQSANLGNGRKGRGIEKNGKIAKEKNWDTSGDGAIKT